MDARTLTLRLDEVRARLEAGEEIVVADVDALLAQLPRVVPGSPRADVVALQASVDTLRELLQSAQVTLAETLDRIGKGRRGNEGYRSLRAHRHSQRLYRRA